MDPAEEDPINKINSGIEELQLSHFSTDEMDQRKAVTVAQIDEKITEVSNLAINEVGMTKHKQQILTNLRKIKDTIIKNAFEERQDRILELERELEVLKTDASTLKTEAENNFVQFNDYINQANIFAAAVQQRSEANRQQSEANRSAAAAENAEGILESLMNENPRQGGSGTM